MITNQRGNTLTPKWWCSPLPCPLKTSATFCLALFYFLHCSKMVNFVIFKAEQRNTRRSVFAWLWSTPLVSNCLLNSTVYKCALVVLCVAISFHFFSLSLCSWGWTHFVVVGVDCSWVYVWLLSFCLWKFLYVPSMLFHVFKEIKIVPSQIYNFFIKTKIICVIRGNFLFSACSVHDQSFTNTIYCYREIVQ